MRPIINFASLILFTQVCSTYLDELVVNRNKALRIATSWHQEDWSPPPDTPCVQQFYARAFQQMRPSYLSQFLTFSKACELEVTTSTPPVIFGRFLEEGYLPPVQTPPTSLDDRNLDDRGDCPVLGVQQDALQWTQPNNCCPGPTEVPLPDPLHLLTLATVTD